MSSLQIFRQCTASISSRTLRRASADAWARPALAARARRHYSDNKAQASEPGAAEAAESSRDGGAEPGDSALAECQKKLEAKEAEATDLTGRLRYLQADFLNLQRNAAREKEQTKDFAITRFASDLLETVDTLAMALKSVPEAAVAPPASSTPSSETKTADAHLRDLHQGVELTHRVLLQTLFKYQVKPFDPTGEKFDPNRHEALYQAPVPGKEPGSVIDCQKTGYMIKDRVLRAAQVGVAQETS